MVAPSLSNAELIQDCLSIIRGQPHEKDNSTIRLHIKASIRRKRLQQAPGRGNQARQVARSGSANNAVMSVIVSGDEDGSPLPLAAFVFQLTADICPHARASSPCRETVMTKAGSMSQVAVRGFAPATYSLLLRVVWIPAPWSRPRTRSSCALTAATRES